MTSNPANMPQHTDALDASAPARRRPLMSWRRRLAAGMTAAVLAGTGAALAVAGGGQTATAAPAVAATSAPTCLATQLSAAQGPSSAGAGQLARSYAFINSSKTTCSLLGYPGFQLYGSTGTPLTTTVARTPGPEPRLTLAPGGRVWFDLQYATQTGYENLSCPTSAALEITPPNDYGHLVVTGTAGTLQPYGGTIQHLQCGDINVQPVAATNNI